MSDMTIAERNNKLKHFITCLKCEVSGKICDIECSTQYDAGNMGEIIENLEVISKILEQEQEPILDKIRAEIEQRPYGVANDSVIQGMKYERVAIFEILDKYKAETEQK